MENACLLELLEEDREMILAGIARDRSPAAVQATLEKALDRVMLRASERFEDAADRESAQLALSSVKSALPLIDSIGEVRRWQRQAGASERRRAGALAWVALAGGALLVAGAVLGLAFAGGRLGVLAPVKALVPAALGAAAVFWAGTRFAKPARPSEPERADVRDEYLVDPERLWHRLRGAVMVADGAVEGLRGRRQARERQTDRTAQAAGPLERGQVELFSGLLENAYAQDGDVAREMAESIRFYLHGAQVEVVDYEKGREAWFEFLPAQRPGTIRPALVSGDKLIRKGMASS